MAMLRNLHALLIAIVLCGVSPGLLAAPNENASSTAKEKSSQNSGNGNGNGNGNNNGNGNGNGKGKNEALPATDGDADQVLDEVNSNGSVELQEVLAAVATISSGRMLEIEPRRIGGRLYYDVTVMETAGVVRHILVDARTGKARSLP